MCVPLSTDQGTRARTTPIGSFVILRSKLAFGSAVITGQI